MAQNTDTLDKRVRRRDTDTLDKRVRRRVSAALLDRNQSQLARQLDLSRQALTPWVRTGVIPPRRVLELAPLIGLAPHEIRPDIYPPNIYPPTES